MKYGESKLRAFFLVWGIIYLLFIDTVLMVPPLFLWHVSYKVQKKFVDFGSLARPPDIDTEATYTVISPTELFETKCEVNRVNNYYCFGKKGSSKSSFESTI